MVNNAIKQLNKI